MSEQSRKSMMVSLPALGTMVAGLVLLVLTALQWRSNGWDSLVWLLALAAMFAIRTPHSLRNRANAIVASRKDATEIVLLSAMFAAAMLLPLLHLATGLFAFADYSLPAWATAIGAIVQILFLWLFWRSHRDLGRNWSPGLEVHEDHKLVTSGVYARMRNPMYAAIWLSSLAQPLLIHNWIAGFLVIPAFTTMWFIRVPNEEKLMQARFEDAWETYCTQAGRLLPRLK